MHITLIGSLKTCKKLKKIGLNYVVYISVSNTRNSLMNCQSGILGDMNLRAKSLDSLMLDWDYRFVLFGNFGLYFLFGS